MKAVEVLIEHGVPEERIIFINLVRFFEFPLPTYSTFDDLNLILVDRFSGRFDDVLYSISVS